MSRKEEIRKKLKKEQKKELEKLGLNRENEKYIVSLKNEDDDLKVETFEDFQQNVQNTQNGQNVKMNQKTQVIPFSTKAQKEKKGVFGKVKSFFDDQRKELKKSEKIANQVIELENTYKNMSDEELKNKTQEFKNKLNDGNSLEDILVDAYATVREVAYRTLGLKAFKVQIQGAVVLHYGDIAEMKTGEGKTLTSIFPVYLNALTGNGVHVVTVNEYLAERDYLDNSKVFNFLGLTVGLNKTGISEEEKKQAYLCDITYTTNSELGFDYLRDNMVLNFEDKVMRGMNFALIDEVDSILIDEARTPLIISGSKKKSASLYLQADRFVKKLKEDIDYEKDLESKTVALTETGIKKAEKEFKIKNLFSLENTEIIHRINQSLKANYTMDRDVDYMITSEDGSKDIKKAEIMIIDQFTGRVMPGRAFSDGLHQAIEAKEGVPIKEENETCATITYQNFFRLYKKLCGMTGTAKTEEEEFRIIYNMRVIEIPTNKPVIRDDKHDKIYSTKVNKFKALCDEVVARHSYGQPILIGTISVETSERVSKMLTKRKIPHNVLNAKNHAKEAEIIARAGQKGAVTIATNMAGRGTDIKLGDGVAEIGGLAVIGSERHESRRIDNQLRGRSGRQGDPGYSIFYTSFEDDIVIRFANEKTRQFSSYMNSDEAIDNKMISKSIETAQRKIENKNFEVRKNVIEYDEIMRQQREMIYSERDKVLTSENLDDMILGTYKKSISNIIKKIKQLEINKNKELKKNKNSKKDRKGNNENSEIENNSNNTNYLRIAAKEISRNYMNNAEISLNDKFNFSTVTDEELSEELAKLCFNNYKNLINSRNLEDSQKKEYERAIILQSIDKMWISHMERMTELKNSIYLRAYAQKDPVQEYAEEGTYMFENTMNNISDMISYNLEKYLN